MGRTEDLVDRAFDQALKAAQAYSKGQVAEGVKHHFDAKVSGAAGLVSNPLKGIVQAKKRCVQLFNQFSGRLSG